MNDIVERLREEAGKAMYQYAHRVSVDILIEAAETIKGLMPKTARWEDTYKDGDWHCSNCGAIVEKDEQINHSWYYCYHCGAKMENPFRDTVTHWMPITLPPNEEEE